ncbi:MAG: pilus assembly protein CpaB [Chloroflexus sp.]
MQRSPLLPLLLVLIIVVGGVAAFLVFRSGALDTSAEPPEVPPPPTAVPLVRVVQARVDIDAGTLLTDPGLLSTKDVPANEFDEANEFSNINDVLGKLLINSVIAGQPIRRENLREPGLAQRIPTPEPGRPALKAYPLIVNSLSGIADQVAVNDIVDIIASFAVERQIIRPSSLSVITVNGSEQLVREYDYGESQTLFATKTIVQRARVLQIVRPATTLSEGSGQVSDTAPPTSSSLPQVDASGQPVTSGQDSSGSLSTSTEGYWIVILALTDQEIELLEFALQSQARIVMTLRRFDDNAVATTRGVTLDLLVREFGLPLPQPLPPRVYGENEVFQPAPTPTPLP